jgi:hypothetical protein
MGIEVNGHEWDWFEQRCKHCGMLRGNAWSFNLLCLGFTLQDVRGVL